ncbi:putative leucine-rich repeat receptor-like serine/threonine-protein kinase At2g24130 [Cryptomeria japonica]|uniref:putative leucine-rich repeat receptor-like serine/threonine-protein kinase At2g24130 n=1 Tax=Cryptomeria japonica TaxID=3369 RepID=UPI0027DAA5FD|nr:putative leucine-rich repeat receptor-like serine/threonine-protein kinase At2g24130 [Cryptomeria japonica]
MIAIKTLNFQNEEALKSLKRECKLLGRIRHHNLIRIIDAFFYPDFKGLVLHFACNGSLEKHLNTNRDDQDFSKLGLSEYLSITIDVAHGMEYLHHDCPLQIVHCDSKPSNVLLDANMTALVTDFEYGLGGNVSTKGDVYSYGILILEMVTRKRPSDDIFVGDMNLPKWVSLAFPDRLADVVDSEVLKDVNENMEDNRCLVSFIHVGLLCTAESPRERPSMRDVSNVLERLKTSLMGDATASNLTSTISDLLRNTDPTEALQSGSQSSTS